MKKTALILFLALAFFSPGRITSSDAGVRLLISRALWTSGSVFTERTLANAHYLIPHPHDVTRGTSFYGIGQSLLFIPFDILGVAAAKMVTTPAAKAELIETLPVVFLYGPLMGLLLWLGMLSLLGRLEYSARVSQRASTLILFGTTALIYSVGILQEELPIAVCLCWGLSLTLAYLETRQRRILFFAALLGAAPFLFRMNVVFAYLPMLGLVADRVRIRKGEPLAWRAVLTTILLGVLPVLAVFAAFSYFRYGQLFTTGYSKLGDVIQLVPINLKLALGLIVGPGKGYLALSPILLLALHGLRREKGRFFFFNGGLFLAFLISSVAYSRLAGAAFPDGSESWGNRFQLHFVFLFAVGLAAFFERCRFSAVAKGVVGVSLALQVVSCWAPDALDAFGYPGELEYDRRQRLLLSFTAGQLSQRVKTVTYSVAKNYPPIWINGGGNLQITQTYVPNLWGPVFYKKLGRGGLGKLFLMLWLALAGVIVALAFKINDKTFGSRSRLPVE